MPGLMRLTRTPLEAHSWRSDCATPRRPNLAAEYTAPRLPPLTAASEPMNTMSPAARLFMAGNRARARKIWLVRLRSSRALIWA